MAEYYCSYEMGPKTVSGFDWNTALIMNDEYGGRPVPLTPGDSLPYQVQHHTDIKRLSTFTGNLESALADWIRDADFVFGCFAWLTNRTVLDALAGLKYGCQVVVQKEDFLRPDSGWTSQSNVELRERYERLRCGMSQYECPSIAARLSTNWCHDISPVRCAGVSPADRKMTWPRMHHKLAVACKCEVDEAELRFFPYSVWTGSFNPTANGSRSRENAVVIDSESAAEFFIEEWAKVFAMSEPLDWAYEWCAPEYRLGT
jgi:hypothetical protein